MLKKLNKFEHMRPGDLTELISLLDQYQEGIKILAGGTDLLVAMKKGALSPQYIINLKGVQGLDKLEYSEEKQVLKIGALVKIHSLLKSSFVGEKFGLLQEAASLLAPPQVKNMATVGGNVCNASPAADLPPPLMVLNAAVSIVGAQGERKIPVEKFFLGPGKTVLGHNEVVTAIEVPLPPEKALGKYIKYNPGRMSDLAFVNVASMLEMEAGSNICKEVRIALGAVAETPMRAVKAEEYLRGKEISESEISKVGSIASEEARPIDDVRGSAWYRRELIKVLVKRTLSDIISRVQSGPSR